MSKIRWNPETGEAVTFADDETPPAHFLPCHPDDPDRDAKAGSTGQFPPKQPERAPKQTEPQKGEDADLSGGMSKAEVAEALKAGGVDFDPNAKKADLVEKLIGALKMVLTERGIAYEENETARALLDRVVASSAA